jgi:hypothetical protein
MIGNFIYIRLSLLKIKNLYFDINSTLLWIHNIVFQCLGHVMRCLCGNFWFLVARQEVWSSDTYEQSLILVRVQKTGHAYKSQRKSQVRNSLFFLRMRTSHGPLWRCWVVQTSQWDGMACIIPDRRELRILRFRRARMQAISKLGTSHQPFGQFGCNPCTFHILNCRNKWSIRFV